MRKVEEYSYKDHPYEGRILWNRFKEPNQQMSSRMILRNTVTLMAKKLTLQNLISLVLVFGVIFTYINIRELHNVIHLKQKLNCESELLNSEPFHRKFAVHGKRVDSGYLKHVFEIFEKFGYKRVDVEDSWDVLWSHDYPFRVLKQRLTDLKASQKVNHFPGSGFITNKMNLATSDLPYVPKAFQIPKQKEQLIKYATDNPHKRFVQKSNNHRGIKIEKIENLNLTTNNTFIQEYITNPLLIDGHKFDIGVYTVLTSINPLRIYMHSDVLLRFCPQTYHPFDPDDVDKYVVRDDYLPIWKVPSIAKFYSDLGFGMKGSLDEWYKFHKKKNPEAIWAQVEAAIRAMYLKKEAKLIETTEKYTGSPSTRNFFEMVRIDFVVDDDGKVFVMEANMSPNLSSAHFPPNQLLYRQVLFNILGLVGVGSAVGTVGRSPTDTTQVSDQHVAVFGQDCVQEKCLYDCESTPCSLCHHCVSEDTAEAFRHAYLEQVNRGGCIRIFPPNSRFNASLLQEHGLGEQSLKTYSTSKLSEVNKLQLEWFRGKCELDASFC